MTRFGLFALPLFLAGASTPAYASAPSSAPLTMMPPPPPDAPQPGENGVSEPASAPGTMNDPAAGPTPQPAAPAPVPEPEPEPEPEPDVSAEVNLTPDGVAPAGDDDFVLPPKNRITYTSILAGRVNPLGLEERLWIGYQRRITDKTDPLWNQANVALFFNPILTPALLRIGGTLQVQPLSILRLRATYGWFPWFGNFQYMQSYESPHDEHAPSDLNRGRDADENYATGGQTAELDALFQIKVKKFALRNDTQAFWYKMRLRGADDVFYDIRIDAMVPNGGWALVNDTDALFVTDFGLAAGVRGTVTKAFFPDRVYEDGDDRSDPNGPMVRVGPMLAYTFFDRPGSKFNKPTLVLIPQWNVVHRYRTGRDTHAAIPTLVIGFGFGGTLSSFGEE